jgi:hypothetical protein
METTPGRRNRTPVLVGGAGPGIEPPGEENGSRGCRRTMVDPPLTGGRVVLYGTTKGQWSGSLTQNTFDFRPRFDCRPIDLL